MSSPAPNANVPQIPQPLADVGALAVAVRFLKQGMDSLAGYRGRPNDRAVTFNDLLNLGVVNTVGNAAILGVTAIIAGTGLNGGTITGTGTISLGTIGAHALMGNPNSVAAVPAGVTVGTGLSLNALGTLIATGTGVTTIIAGAGLNGGTITSTGTISLAANPTVTGSLTVQGPIVPTYPANGITGNVTGSLVAAGVVGEIISSDSGGFNQSATVTLTLGSPGTVNWTAHGITGICAVQFTTTGALPTGLSAAPTTYWTVPASITTNSFKVATSIANAIAGTQVNFTGSQSGVQTGFAYANVANDTATDVAAIRLTPGDWDIYGAGAFLPAGGTITTFFCWLGTTSATVPADQKTAYTQTSGIAATTALSISGLMRHINVSAATTIFLSVQMHNTNGSNSNGGYGGLWARRR